jgi:riboflavin kinase/FMN adenylyltransferase
VQYLQKEKKLLYLQSVIAFMNIYQDLNNLPKFKNAVVTIGSFDGVHKAHRKLISRVNQIAQEVGGEACVVTFYPHPRSIVFPGDKSLSLLSTIEEKLEIFRACGVQNLIVVPFTVEFAQLSAQEYIEKFLINTLNVKHLVVGYDHRFGLARRGDFQMLKMYEKTAGYKLIEIEKQEIEEIAISSTNIRNALYDGDMATATAFLGDYYLIMGKVVRGDGLGRTIGYPTANVQVDVKNKLIPPIGIYTCYVEIAEKTYGGMLYIGPRPTVSNSGNIVVEVNIFDFNESIYGETIGVKIVSLIREDKKFEGLDALKLQIDNDFIAAKKILEEEAKKKVNVALVTISILNYDGVDMLEAYLPSVLESSDTINFDILIIDNNSSDESVEYIKEWHPEIEVLELGSNYGFAEGYNIGNKNIKSKYTVLLNSDVKVTEGWLDGIITLMESNDKIGAVQPKILSLEEATSFEYAGASGGMMDALGYPYCRGRLFDTVEDDEGQYDDTKEVFWCSGAAMVVRTDVFANLGGFDGDYFAHQEEVDFCWRIKKAGYKCYVYPSSVVYHLGGGTLNYENPKKTYLNFRNNLLTILKNESFPKVIFISILRIMLDGVAGIKFLTEKKYKDTLAIIRAHGSVYRRTLTTMRKRVINNIIINKHGIADQNDVGKTNNSIVVQYFLQGKKKYSDLK